MRKLGGVFVGAAKTLRSELDQNKQSPTRVLRTGRMWNKKSGEDLRDLHRESSRAVSACVRRFRDTGCIGCSIPPDLRRGYIADAVERQGGDWGRACLFLYKYYEKLEVGGFFIIDDTEIESVIVVF